MLVLRTAIIIDEAVGTPAAMHSFAATNSNVLPSDKARVDAALGRLVGGRNAARQTLLELHLLCRKLEDYEQFVPDTLPLDGEECGVVLERALEQDGVLDSWRPALKAALQDLATHTLILRVVFDASVSCSSDVWNEVRLVFRYYNSRSLGRPLDDGLFVAKYETGIEDLEDAASRLNASVQRLRDVVESIYRGENRELAQATTFMRRFFAVLNQSPNDLLDSLMIRQPIASDGL